MGFHFYYQGLEFTTRVFSPKAATTRVLYYQGFLGAPNSPPQAKNFGGIFLLQSKEMQLKSYFDGQNSTPQAGKNTQIFLRTLKKMWRLTMGVGF